MQVGSGALEGRAQAVEIGVRDLSLRGAPRLHERSSPRCVQPSVRQDSVGVNAQISEDCTGINGRQPHGLDWKHARDFKCTRWWRIVPSSSGLRPLCIGILQILSLSLFEFQAIDQDFNFADNVKQLIVVDFKPDSREP